MIEYLAPPKVLRRALRMVKEATTLIQGTHLRSLGPPPKRYMNLLQQKRREGVKVQRIVFRPEEERAYQRMLIVDGKEMLFAIEKKDLTLTFYTDNPLLLKRFSRYFEKCFQQRPSPSPHRGVTG